MRAALLLLLLFPLSAPAQNLEIRQISPFEVWNLSDSVGVVPDSMRRVGRGTWIRDLRLGVGDSVGSGDNVTVHYVGRLADGTIFSATTDTPYSFRLGDGAVIDGWEDGVPGMRPGGHRQLVIPPWLGYGARGNRTIPPDAVLVFEILLLKEK